MNIQDWFLFRNETFDLLVVQGTLKSLLQNHSSKHQFFGAQLSLQSNSQHPCMTAGKTIALTRWTFVAKVIPLLFNMLCSFSSKSKHFLISWLQPSAVILEPSKIKSDTVSPSISYELMGANAMILVF